MATTTTQPPKAVSNEESDKFIDGAIKELQDDKKGTFADNVGKVGKWAIEVDEAFFRVTAGLSNLTTKYGSEFAELKTFLGQWQTYKKTWDGLLQDSRDTASKTVILLKRFDKIFIDMILEIQSDQDRLDVIEELKSFMAELDKTDDSTRLSQGFNGLRHDIEDFVKRFDDFVKETGEKLEEEAKVLQEQINTLKAAVEDLDKQVKEATKALLGSAAGATTMVGCIGLAVSGSVLIALLVERAKKAGELSDAQKRLEEVNRKQKAIAQVKSDFDGLKPDIALICDRLVMFAEIWSSVRSQIVQFEASLQGGMEAVRNIRFKKELKLSQELCKPLEVGLEKYATELKNRG